MKTILITGASGFLGKALAQSLSLKYRVLNLSRKNPQGPGEWLRGDFSYFEDLRQLDAYKIDAAIHLGAATGGCLERDGMLVNVEGTRVLLRYLIDHGTKKLVTASSIAAIGFQSTAFRPLKLPIPDDHPCLDVAGYGFSKYLMEELTRYFARQNPEIDIINLRLASIVSNDQKPKEPCELRPWALGSITAMLQEDAVRVFSLAVESPLKPGVRLLNATCDKIWSRAKTATVLQNWWGEKFDTSYFKKHGHEWDSPYDVSAIKKELNFEATATLKVLNQELYPIS